MMLLLMPKQHHRHCQTRSRLQRLQPQEALPLPSPTVGGFLAHFAILPVPSLTVLALHALG